MEHLFLHCTDMLENQHGIYLSLFLGGLVGSIAHCSMMCSPFILTLCTVTKGDALLTKLKGAALMPYHLGRLTTYICLGMLVAVFSSAILSSSSKAMLTPMLLCGAGVSFVIMALPQKQNLMKFEFPFLASLIKKIAHPLMNNSHHLNQYILGCVLGFLPCGLVYAALMMVIVTETPLEAAFGMMLFGLGTLPILFAVAFFGQVAFSKVSFLRGNFRKGLMVFNAFNLFIIAGLKII